MAGKIIYCWKIRFYKLDIFLASSQKGAVRIGIRWADEHMDPAKYFKRYFPDEQLLIDEYFNTYLMAGIKRLLSGKEEVKIDLDCHLTPFQWKVLTTIKQIPYGSVMTYKDIAWKIGSPKAFRAVGQALKRNPLPILFP